MARCLITACALLGCLSLAAASPQSDASKTAALLELQRKSSTGVIELNTQLFEEFVSGKSRPYSLIVVADSKNMRNQGKLQLGALLSEYSLAARTFATEHAGKKSAGHVFFTKVEFTNAKDLFGRMGIKSLPYMARIPPSMPISKDGAVKLKQEDHMSDASYPWSAEAIARFVEEKTGVHVGEIKRASFLHSRFMPFITLGFLGVAAVVGYHLYYLPLMRNTWIYVLGALVVWWFSVSGGMYNIIRGVPLVGWDQRSKTAMLFMSGGGQLGAEGFIMGSLYTSFGLCAAAFCALLPRVKDPKAQRLAGYGLIALALLAYRSVVANHLWKTGMTTSWYFF